MGNFYGTPTRDPPGSGRTAPILVGCCEPWLTLIKQGHKTVECRKATPKWAGVKVGDILTFADMYSVDLAQSLVGFGVEVVGISRYPPGKGVVRRFLATEGLGRVLPGVSSLEKGEAVFAQWATLDAYDELGLVGLTIRPLVAPAAAPVPAAAPAAPAAPAATPAAATPAAAPAAPAPVPAAEPEAAPVPAAEPMAPAPAPVTPDLPPLPDDETPAGTAPLTASQLDTLLDQGNRCDPTEWADQADQTAQDAPYEQAEQGDGKKDSSDDESRRTDTEEEEEEAREEEEEAREESEEDAPSDDN